MATFLRKFIYKFQVKAEPLEKRKTELLAGLQKEGQKTTNINKKARHFKLQQVIFTPTPLERESFKLLQDGLTFSMRLHHHNPAKRTFFKLDASGRGIGVFIFHLKQDHWTAPTIPVNQIQPIMFLSRLLHKAERRYKPTELKVACLI
ncbi:hypothetical protein V8C26DRAFT_413224 [Trichoderma gracile]